MERSASQSRQFWSWWTNDPSCYKAVSYVCLPVCEGDGTSLKGPSNCSTVLLVILLTFEPPKWPSLPKPFPFYSHASHWSASKITWLAAAIPQSSHPGGQCPSSLRAQHSGLQFHPSVTPQDVYSQHRRCLLLQHSRLFSFYIFLILFWLYLPPVFTWILQKGDSISWSRFRKEKNFRCFNINVQWHHCISSVSSTH